MTTDDRPRDPGLEAALARHGPTDALAQLRGASFEDLRDSGSTSVHATVAVGDLRMSGLLLREAVNPTLYARFLIGFTEAVRTLAVENRGWFDKFTGDGFVVFWIYPDDEHLPISAIPPFCQAVVPASERLVANLKRNSRNFPAGVGLALGLDSGPCELVRVGEAITVVGSPIVGATRMATGARGREVVLNVRLGEALEDHRARWEGSGMLLEKTVVRTKEYPEGQEAYCLRFASPGGNGPGRASEPSGSAPAAAPD